MISSENSASSQRLLDFDSSGSKRTAVYLTTLQPAEKTPHQDHDEERLLYFLDGRGVISIYEEFPEGDVYEIRQDVSVFMTPGITYEIFNIGDVPLRYVEFLVKGGVKPAGDLSWSAVTQRGVTVENPSVGAGVAVTDVFDEASNRSQREGQHLQIRDIQLRRPQKFANAEILTVAPGRATRRHTHFDTGETSYVISGEGEFVWDDERIPCKPGSVISYPIGVQRQVINTGRFPLTYVLIASFLE